MKVSVGEKASVRATRGRLVVNLAGAVTAKSVRAVLHRWYLDRARAAFDSVLDIWVSRFKDVDRPRLSIRGMQTRWGSLSAAGTMTLNADLVRAARPCIEYVVVHELCHLKHRDHGAEFFQLLGRMMPDWEKRKERLEAALI